LRLSKDIASDRAKLGVLRRRFSVSLDNTVLAATADVQNGY
jgi:hypothetical protein